MEPEVVFDFGSSILGSPFGVSDFMVSCDLQKAYLRNVRFPSVLLGCNKTFSCRLCAGYRKTAVLCPHRKLPECFTTAQSITHPFIGLPPRSLHITRVMVYFRY